VDALKRNLKSGQAGHEIRAAVAILDHAVQAVEVLDLAEAAGRPSSQAS